MRLQPNASEALSPPVTRELLCALHHNSKGDKTTLRQQERFPEVPVTTREEPKTSGFNLGNITRYTSQCKMRHISPAATREQSCTLPCNSKGGLTSLRKHARFPSFIFKNLEEPKASCWNSRKTKSSNHNHHHCKHEMRPFSPAAPQEQSGMPFWNSKGGLNPFIQLKRFPEIPVTTREEPQVSRHNSKRAPFSPPHLKISADSPASTQRNPNFPLAPQAEACPPYWNPRGTVRFLLQVERTPTSPSIWEKASLPWKDSNGTPSIPWPHKGRSDYPVAALPKVKVPCVNSTGGLTPFFQFDWKVEFHASTRAEGWLPCWNSMGSPRSLLQLERKLDSCHNKKWVHTSLQALKGIPRCPSELERRSDLPEATCQAPRRPWQHSKWAQMWLPATTQETSWDSPLNARWGLSPLQWLEPPSAPPCNSKGDLTSLRHHEKFPWGTRGSSRGTPSFWWQPEKPRDFPL